MARNTTKLQYEQKMGNLLSKYWGASQKPDYEGRKVDVLVRSIKNYVLNDPIRTIYMYLQHENTTSSKELAKKAVVLLYPESLLGKIVWYKQKK